MESRVRLSRFSLILTWLINLCLVIGLAATFGEWEKFLILLFLLVVLILCGLIYGPCVLKLDVNGISVRSSIRVICRIPIADIESIMIFQPTMGAIRICASGGYWGYWGTFRESDIGTYSAYYGKASDCFLIITKQGKKYVLGCEHPDEVVAYIKKRISVRQ